jgi:hypothetical protein
MILNSFPTFAAFMTLDNFFTAFLLLMRCWESTYGENTRYFGTYGAFQAFWLARACTSSCELGQAQKRFLQVY